MKPERGPSMVKLKDLKIFIATGTGKVTGILER